MPPNGDGNLFGLGLSISLGGSFVEELPSLSDPCFKKECLLLNLFRKLFFFKLYGETVVDLDFSSSSISFDRSSDSCFLKLLGLNEGLLKPDNLEVRDFNLDGIVWDDTG